MQPNWYSASLFDRLKNHSSDQWSAYCNHEFVNRVGDGSLPIESFRYYLVQDYLFLIHFSRAWALLAYKSDSVADMQWASQILHATLNTEMSLHVEFSARYGVTQDQMEAAEEAQPNLSYTRFVLDRGSAGDILDLYVALLPCTVGYAEIGNRLNRDCQQFVEGNPYREWIEMYSSEDYQQLALKSISVLERLSRERGGMARFDSLAETFRKATVLETGFWQMCCLVPGVEL